MAAMREVWVFGLCLIMKIRFFCRLLYLLVVSIEKRSCGSMDSPSIKLRLYGKG
jgi:hypothetical protein